MSDITVTTEPTSEVKTNKVVDTIKKFKPTKSQLKAAAVGAGVALTGVAVAVVFALKRQDEADFDEIDVTFVETEEDQPDVVVIHENH